MHQKYNSFFPLDKNENYFQTQIIPSKMAEFYKEINQLTIEAESKIKAKSFEDISEVIRAAAREGKRHCTINRVKEETSSLIDSMEELGNFQITHRGCQTEIDWKYEMVSYQDLERENEKLKQEIKELRQKYENEQKNCTLLQEHLNASDREEL